MRACNYVSLIGSSALVLVFSLAACGGSKPEAKGPDNAAGATSSASSPGAAPAAGSGAPEPAPTAASTTTMTLGDKGDLQGAKLGSSSTTVIENKTDGAPRPKGSGEEPGRTAEDIKAIIVARRAEARACYDEGLKKNPQLGEGNLDIKWKIDTDGNVTEAGLDDSRSSIHDKAVGECIAAIIRKVHFAKSTKGYESTMHYPFDFHPKAGQVGRGAQPQQGQPQH